MTLSVPFRRVSWPLILWTSTCGPPSGATSRTGVIARRASRPIRAPVADWSAQVRLTAAIVATVAMRTALCIRGRREELGRAKKVGPDTDLRLCDRSRKDRRKRRGIRHVIPQKDGVDQLAGFDARTLRRHNEQRVC